MLRFVGFDKFDKSSLLDNFQNLFSSKGLSDDSDYTSDKSVKNSGNVTKPGPTGSLADSLNRINPLSYAKRQLPAQPNQKPQIPTQSLNSDNLANDVSNNLRNSIKKGVVSRNQPFIRTAKKNSEEGNLNSSFISNFSTASTPPPINKSLQQTDSMKSGLNVNDSLFLQNQKQQRKPSNSSVNQTSNMFRTDSPQFENPTQFEYQNKKNHLNSRQSKNNSNELFDEYNSNDSNLYEENNVPNKKPNNHRNSNRSPTPNSLFNDSIERKNEYETNNNWSKTSKTSDFEANNFDMNETNNFQNEFVAPKKSARRRWQEAFAIIRRQISVSTKFLIYFFLNRF